MSELSAIRQVKADEFDAIWDFYMQVVDDLEGKPNGPGWGRGLYPTEDLLHGFIERGEMWAGDIDGQLAAVANMNHNTAPGYEEADWQITAAPEQVVAIHTLAVNPDFQGRGIAKQLVAQIIEKAREAGYKAIRLDVMPSNESGRKVYEACGFSHRGLQRIYYKETDWVEAHMYEYVL